MKKKIIVHIGSPKTATSSIQDYLYKNRDVLLSNLGVFYPAEHLCEEGRIANGTLLLPKYFDEDNVVAKFKKWLMISDYIVLSEELLFIADGLSKLPWLSNLNDVDITVVAYLRNAADYLASLWAEFNKFENNVVAPTLEDFLNSKTYLSSLGNLRSLMKECQNFTYVVRPYRQLSGKGDTLTDFLGFLGINDDFSREPKSNLSITRRECDIRQLCLKERWQIPNAMGRDKISRVALELESGDKRPVIQTLSDELIKTVCDKHTPALNDLMRTVRHDFSFDNVYPSCFGKQRLAYEPVNDLEYEKLRSLLFSER